MRISRFFVYKHATDRAENGEICQQNVRKLDIPEINQIRGVSGAT